MPANQNVVNRPSSDRNQQNRNGLADKNNLLKIGGVALAAAALVGAGVAANRGKHFFQGIKKLRMF